MGFIETLGMQAAGGALGAGMGLLLGNENDRRQRNQQKALQETQIKGQKEMSDYNYAKQKLMWEETNYPAQVEMLKKAGLNPALIYGMSGGGGTTTGSQGGSVTGATTQQGGGGEAMGMAGMGMQLPLIMAQTELIKAQKAKAETETTKIGGVDTELAKANVESTWQGIDNARNTNTLQKLDMTMKNIENFEKQASQEDRLDYIKYQASIAEKQMRLLGNEQSVSDATIQDNIKRIRAEAIGAVLKNELTLATTERTKVATQLDYKEMNKIAQEIMMSWDRIGQGNQEIEIRRILQQYGTDPTKDAMKQITETIGDIMKRR